METEGPGLFLTIIAFLGGFSVLVFIHEWGHYSVARFFGIRVDTFSIGMGKEIWGRTAKSGTRWRISAIPLGGYVKFFGDASAASNPGDIPEGLTEQEKAECFHYKPVWQRALVVFAGPAVNLIAAVLVYAAFSYGYGIRIAEPVINQIQAESAAEKAGLLPGDRILSVNGSSIDRFSDIQGQVRLNPGRTIEVIVDRNGQQTAIPVLLDITYMEDRFGNRYPLGRLGVSSNQLKVLDLGLLGALGEGVRQTVSTADMMLTSMGQMILGIRSGKEMGGPARIANMVGEAAAISWGRFILILALLSLNLGIVNLLPIPVLDGGHLVFYGLEAIKGSPLSKKAQEASFIAGMALMLIFMVFVTLNDLQSMAL